MSEHNLRIIAMALDDYELRNLASDLEDLIVSSPHLLYPNRWPMPRIPYEQYDEGTSIKAVDLARKIMAIVHKKIYE